jgi:hypothetical protein
MKIPNEVYEAAEDVACKTASASAIVDAVAPLIARQVAEDIAQRIEADGFGEGMTRRDDAIIAARITREYAQAEQEATA